MHQGESTHDKVRRLRSLNEGEKLSLIFTQQRKLGEIQDELRHSNALMRRVRARCAVTKISQSPSFRSRMNSSAKSSIVVLLSGAARGKSQGVGAVNGAILKGEPPLAHDCQVSDFLMHGLRKSL